MNAIFLKQNKQQEEGSLLEGFVPKDWIRDDLNLALMSLWGIPFHKLVWYQIQEPMDIHIANCHIHLSMYF